MHLAQYLLLHSLRTITLQCTSSLLRLRVLLVHCKTAMWNLDISTKTDVDCRYILCNVKLYAWRLTKILFNNVVCPVESLLVTILTYSTDDCFHLFLFVFQMRWKKSIIVIFFCKYQERQLPAFTRALLFRLLTFTSLMGSASQSGFFFLRLTDWSTTASCYRINRPNLHQSRGVRPRTVPSRRWLMDLCSAHTHRDRVLAYSPTPLRLEGRIGGGPFAGGSGESGLDRFVTSSAFAWRPGKF